MGKEILTFDDNEIVKNKFYRHETPTFLKHVEIEKELVSNKIKSVLMSKKNFIVKLSIIKHF